MITFPNAKINLGLNIVEKRPDGYHNLETIFYPINLQDALEVNRMENSQVPYKLRVSGTAIEGSPEENLVVKAYNLLREKYELAPVDIHREPLHQSQTDLTHLYGKIRSVRIKGRI